METERLLNKYISTFCPMPSNLQNIGMPHILKQGATPIGMRMYIMSKTMVPASTWHTVIDYLVFFNVFTVPMISRVQVSAWQLSSASYTGTADGYGQKENQTRVRAFILHFRMNVKNKRQLLPHMHNIKPCGKLDNLFLDFCFI